MVGKPNARRLRIAAVPFVLAVLVLWPAGAAADGERISTGYGVTCATDRSEHVICWGEDDWYRGMNGTYTGLGPHTIAGLDEVVGLGVGEEHVCTLQRDGVPKCWGRAVQGELGLGATTTVVTPTAYGSIDDGVDIAVGDWATCVVRSDTSLWCSGHAEYNSIGTRRTVPTASPGMTGVAEVVRGPFRMCARMIAGSVRCWGNGQYGELGGGAAGNSSTPVTVVGIADAVDVAVGRTHVCAVLASGGVRCWGRNTYGQLGDGTTTARLSPVAVVGIDDAVEVAAASSATCARLATGAVKCWGSGRHGLVGDLTAANALTPVTIAGLDDAVAISGGAPFLTSDERSTYGTFCAAQRSGNAVCWGTNYRGEAGTGGKMEQSTPRAMEGVIGATRVALGVVQGCVVAGPQGVRCSGGTTGSYSNEGDALIYPGILGNGPARRISAAPIAVPGTAGATDVAAAGFNACAIVGGAVKCWGLNNRQQLGSADVSAVGPATVPGVADATSLAVGGTGYYNGPDEGRAFACAVDAGAAKCWGGEIYFGDNTQQTSAAPRAATTTEAGNPAIADAVMIAVSRAGYAGQTAGRHVCVIRLGGSVWCWGMVASLGGASGTLGRASQVQGLPSAATDLALGARHSCALVAGGRILCWGDNEEGALGRGPGGPSTDGTPVRVLNIGDDAPLGPAVDIEAAGRRTCAVLQSRAIYCWGPQSGGATPTALAGVADATRVTLGTTYDRAICWVTLTATVKCMGYDRDGAFGSRSGWTDALVPVAGFVGLQAPSAPVITDADPGDTTIAVAWRAPANSPGVTGYTATAQPGGATCTWTSGPLGCTLTGLANGTQYTVKVRAINAVGAGVESAGERATPFGVPGAPTSAGMALRGSSVAAWVAGYDWNGATPNRIELVTEPGGYRCVVASSFAQLPAGGCDMGIPYAAYGVEYRVRGRVANAAGWGAWSEWSAGFAPRDEPGSPVQVDPRAGDQRALIAWTASQPRGAPVERYVVCMTTSTADPLGPECGTTFARARKVCDVPAEPDEVAGRTVHACTVTGLRNGQSMRALVRAVNAVGWSNTDGANRWFTPSTRVEPTTTATGFARVRVRCASWRVSTGCWIRVRLEVDFKPYLFRSPRIRLEPGTWTDVDVGMPEGVRERLGAEGFARARVVVESSPLEVVEAPQVLELAAPPADGVGEVRIDPAIQTDKVVVGVPCSGTRYQRCTGYLELNPFSEVRARAGAALARVRFSVRGGEVARVEVRLNARGRALLRRQGELTVRPTLVMSGGTRAPRLAPVRFVAARTTVVGARVEAVAGLLDRTALLAVVRAAAAQDLAWADAAVRLERDVLPVYRRAVVQARAVAKGSPRMREARELLIAAALRQVAATEGYIAWLREDDLVANQRAVVDDRTARAWLHEALRLARAEQAGEAP